MEHFQQKPALAKAGCPVFRRNATTQDLVFCPKIVNRRAEPEHVMTPDARFRQTPGAEPERLFSAPGFSAPYAPPDEEIAARLLAQAERPAAAEGRIDRLATGLIEAIRPRPDRPGGVALCLPASSASPT